MNNFYRSICTGLLLLFSAGSLFAAESANNNFNSLLWMQASAEYKANTIQAYNTALRNINAALRDRKWTAAKEQVGPYSLSYEL